MGGYIGYGWVLNGGISTALHKSQSSLQTFLEAGNLNEMIKQDFLHWTKAGQLGENGQFDLSGQFMKIALAACYASPFITGSVQLQNLSFRDLGSPDWGSNTQHGN